MGLVVSAQAIAVWEVLVLEAAAVDPVLPQT